MTTGRVYTETEVQELLKKRNEPPKLVSVVILGVMEDGSLTQASQYNANGLHVQVLNLEDLEASEETSEEV